MNDTTQNRYYYHYLKKKNHYLSITIGINHGLRLLFKTLNTSTLQKSVKNHKIKNLKQVSNIIATTKNTNYT